jgi:VIT1/CCC1 family predicted Fe2+/Mn2+ transporter
LLRLAQVPFLTGMAQGPLLPVALIVALAASGADTRALLTAGLAALAAGAVVAGVGRYFATLAAAERYAAERRREETETHDYPERERWEVAAVLHRYGLRGEALSRAVDSVAADRTRWVDFMMRFELDLTEPQPAHAAKEAFVLAAGVLGGGTLALLPLLLFPGFGWLTTLAVGAAVAAAAGWLLGRAEGQVPAGGALRAVLLSGLALLAALAGTLLV